MLYRFCSFVLFVCLLPGRPPAEVTPAEVTPAAVTPAEVTPALSAQHHDVIMSSFVSLVAIVICVCCTCRWD